jgi:hypothetical protein
MKKMNKIVYFLFLALALGVSSCSDNSLENEGIDNGKEMAFSLKVGIPLYANAASSRAGAADPDGDQLNNMYLLCFDENGFYVGKAEATMSGVTSDTNESSATYGQITGTITGTVPVATARIHFLGNTNLNNIDDTHYLGVSENVMIPSLYSGYGVVNYWGYKRCKTPAEMRTYLTGTTEDPVQLIRNQARVAAVDATTSKNSFDIGGIAVCNVSAYGTVALFDNTLFNTVGADPFTNAFTNRIQSTLSDDKKLTADNPKDVVSGSEYNIFESANNASSTVVAIVKAKAKSSGTYKYFKVLLEDKDYNLYEIHRNCLYRINISGLPDVSYDSYDAALNGTPANNPLVTVDEVVATLEYGDYSLSITDGTSQIFSSAGNQTIKFKCTKNGNAVAATDLEAYWLSTGNTVSDGTTKTVAMNSANDGTGTITINLNAVTNSLKSGKLYLRVKNTPLERAINVYSISDFNFEPVYLTQKAKYVNGEEMIVEFSIPENFPKSLLPLKCKITTNGYDAETNNQLQILNEATSSLTGTDWNYKYLYTATTTGPQRIYFRTAGNGYTANAKVWIEADHFSTAIPSPTASPTLNVFTFNGTSSNKILLNGSSYGTTIANGEPLIGKTFDVTYTMNSVTKPLYIYTNNFTPSVGTATTSKYSNTKCYVINTPVSGSTITFTSTKNNYSENIWFESENNKSASVTVNANPEYYSGMFGVTTTSPAYGEGSTVTLTVNFPVAGHTYKIYTKDLEAVSSGLSAITNGFKYTPSTAGPVDLKFKTNRLICHETIKVATDANINLDDVSCVLDNAPDIRYTDQLGIDKFFFRVC